MESSSLSDALHETLVLFEGGGEPLKTAEVADQLDLGRRATYARLDRLVTGGYLETKKVGASARIWWRPPADSARSTVPEPSSAGRFEQELDQHATLFENVRTVNVIFERNGTVRYITPTVTDVFGYRPEVLTGVNGFEYIHPGDRERTMREVSRTLEDDSYEPQIEFRFKHDDGSWLPLEARLRTLRNDSTVDGVVAFTREITHHTEHKQDLERYTEIVDSVSEPVYELDAHGRFTFVNEAFVEQSGYTEAELLGEHVSIGMDEGAIAQAESEILTLLAENPADTAVLEYDVLTKDGASIPVENRISLLTDEDGTVRGSAGALRNISERKQRNQELARFKRAVEAAGHSIYMTDTDASITYVNPAFEETTGYSAEEVLGQSPSTLDSGIHTREYFDRLWDTITSGERWEEEVVNRHKNGELYTAHQIISPVTDSSGDIDRFVAVQTDITERKEREQERETRIRQQEVVTDLGQQALEDRDLDTLMVDAAELVADTLEHDYCKVLDLNTETEELLLRQGVGWDEGIVGTATVSSIESDSQAAYTLSTEHPIVVEDLETESRFSGPDLLTAHGIKSGISVVIGPHDDPWGILGTHDTDQKTFTEQDVNFVQSVANILATALNRYQDEQRLRRHREELAALNNLNTIVSEITETVIGKSTRDEIEQAVCDALANSDSYEFAWLAGVDSQTDVLEPRATAGTDGYAEAITVSLNPDDPRSHGPGATAAREQKIQVVQNVFSDPAFEPWRDAAAEYGFSSLASIPIGYEGTVYGVLGVYADRPNAFDTAERTVISRLGEVIGHAIASTERKRALMGEEIVELTFQVRNVFDEVGIPGASNGTIRFDEAVPLTDGEFLVYGTATSDARASMVGVTEALPRWKAVTFHDADGDSTFELQLSEHAVLSTLASVGASFEKAVIRDGDYMLTVQLAPNADGRALIESVRETYPGVELVTRHQTTREDDQPNANSAVVTELTDRQLVTLQAAYYSGFFEWPRDRSGKDIAESLGIASPTFHHHLRKAEKKVVKAVFSPREHELSSE